MGRKRRPKKCWCGQKPIAYSRCEYSNGKTTALYSWYQCGDTYAHETGDCIKPQKYQHKKMVQGWNKQFKK